MKKTKVTLEEAISFTKYKLTNLEKDYHERAAAFALMVKEGVALTSIHSLDTIRALNFLYTDIAAHRDALRSMNVEI